MLTIYGVLTIVLLFLQSNRMFSCKQHCNIAILIGRSLWAICKRREQIASWNSQKICKQSLWLDYKKEGSQSNSLSNWIGASLFLIVQSQALFTNLLWISTCNLFVLLANCSEQSPYQNRNIVRQYRETILQCCLQENIRFDCKITQWQP